MPTIPPSLPARARGRRVLAAVGITLVAAAGLACEALPAAADDTGRVYAFGGAVHHGSPATPVNGVAAIPTGTGYWTVTWDGTVHAFGDAPDLGSPGRDGAIDITAARSGRGYWVAYADGAVEAYGDATFAGSMAGKPLNSPIVGITATPSGDGYWLVAADGGIFSFGDARFLGSMGGTRLVSPITGIAATPSGDGYWMAAGDGGVFSFGDARYAGRPASGAITAIAAAPRGNGYWLVAEDGNVHAFGDAAEVADLRTTATVVDIAARPQRDGYWIATGAVPAAEPQYRAAAGDPPDSDFDRLAQCESSGNWGSRGGRYEGGLQFLNSTWLAYGGGEFAQHAYDASREQQIEIARRLWRERGWSPWPHCSKAVGLA